MEQQLVITGNEINENINTPIGALVQFYRAFNLQDMQLMQNNWSHGPQAVMSNPLGGIKRGWTNISKIYQRIFHGPADVYVEFFDFEIFETEQMFFAAGRERGSFKLHEQEITLAIRTSRIYTKLSNQWRQVHHHGSIEDPQLLARYQNTVMKFSD